MYGLTPYRNRQQLGQGWFEELTGVDLGKVGVSAGLAVGGVAGIAAAKILPEPWGTVTVAAGIGLIGFSVYELIDSFSGTEEKEPPAITENTGVDYAHTKKLTIKENPNIRVEITSPDASNTELFLVSWPWSATIPLKGKLTNMGEETHWGRIIVRVSSPDTEQETEWSKDVKFSPGKPQPVGPIDIPVPDKKTFWNQVYTASFYLYFPEEKKTLWIMNRGFRGA